MSCLPTILCLHGRWTNMTEFLCSQYTYNGCMNWTCLNLLNYSNCQDYIYPDYFLNHTCVDACSCSCPVPDSPQSPDVAPFVAFNAVMLLAVVLPVIAVNTAILVALALESSIVKVIRLVLANILIASLINALALAMLYSAWIVIAYVTPNPFPTTCTFRDSLQLSSLHGQLDQCSWPHFPLLSM